MLEEQLSSRPRERAMSDAYRRAGVDTEAAAKAVTLIADLAARARRPEVADEVGGFAGLFAIGEGRLLAAATDGVGTKLEVARLTGRLDTVGIDLVAMCADDVVCTGAEPLFFLDYLAVGRVVAGARGRDRRGRRRGMPSRGLRAAGRRDGRAPRRHGRRPVRPRGLLRRRRRRGTLLGPDRVRAGDVLVGLASSGLHATASRWYARRCWSATRSIGAGRSGPHPRGRAPGAVRDLRAGGPVAGERRPAACRRPHHRRWIRREHPPGAAARARRPRPRGTWPAPDFTRPDATTRPTPRCSQPSTWGWGWCWSSTRATSRRSCAAARTGRSSIGEVVAGSGVDVAWTP